jgi:hypothetical protein
MLKLILYQKKIIMPKVIKNFKFNLNIINKYIIERIIKNKEALSPLMVTAYTDKITTINEKLISFEFFFPRKNRETKMGKNFEI